jgi:hypothetical protein
MRSPAHTDVDGTLIRAVGVEANKLHKRAFSHAFQVRSPAHGAATVPQHAECSPQEVYGITASIDEIEARVVTCLTARRPELTGLVFFSTTAARTSWSRWP